MMIIIHMIEIIFFTFELIFCGYNKCSHENLFTTENRMVTAVDSNADDCNYENSFCIVITTMWWLWIWLGRVF